MTRWWRRWYRRLWRRGLIAGFALLLIAGCGDEARLHRGTVVGKEYRAPYTTHWNQCVSYGKYGCTLYVPQTDYHPERFYLRISECVEHWENPDCFTELHATDPYTYQTAQVGDRWDDGTGKPNSSG